MLKEEELRKKNNECVKRYYKRNKDKILEKGKKKFQCKYCNKSFSYSNLSKHNNSQGHLANKKLKQYGGSKRPIIKRKSAKHIEEPYKKKKLTEKQFEKLSAIDQDIYKNPIRTFNLNKIKHGKVKYNVDEYVKGPKEFIVHGKTKQEKINSDPKKLVKKIKNLMQKGRVEITNFDQLLTVPDGSLVSYITKDGLYRSGGYLTHIDKKDRKYFALKSIQPGSKVSWSVQWPNTNVAFVDFDTNHSKKN